jgi:uncharacterized membrane protein
MIYDDGYGNESESVHDLSDKIADLKIELKSFEKNQQKIIEKIDRKHKKTVISAIAVSSLITLIFGLLALGKRTHLTAF